MNVWAGKASFANPKSTVHRKWLSSSEEPYSSMRAMLRAGRWKKYMVPPPEADRDSEKVYCDIKQGKCVVVKKEEDNRAPMYGDLCKFMWEWVILNLPEWRHILCDKSRWANPLPGKMKQVI